MQLDEAHRFSALENPQALKHAPAYHGNATDEDRSAFMDHLTSRRLKVKCRFNSDAILIAEFADGAHENGVGYITELKG